MLLSSFLVTAAILEFLPSYSFSCSENEVDVDCVNSCNTCEQRGRCDTPTTCQHGCDCKPGFFRDERGFCVLEQQCSAQLENPGCPENALHLPCAPLALPTCENPYSEPDYDDECVPGCVCRPGFLMRKDGQCVTPDQCYSKEQIPNICQEDEEYYECLPSCKNTCENINNATSAKCRCGPPGCFCKEGLVKRFDGKCIPPQQCPSSKDPAPKCPQNAIFIQCGSPCPPTCDDLQPDPCEEKCTTACYCKPGYLKRKDGVCVRPIDCHPRKNQERRPAPKCPENAIFIECGSPCPPTCEDRLPVCEEKCTKACYCKPGFLLKTDDAKCVKPENCNTSRIPVEPQTKCGTDEQFYECAPSCKNTCGNIYNPEVKCRCGPPGCFCKEGLVKRTDGKCVTPTQCEVSPLIACGENQKFYNCTPSCKNTCEKFFNPAVRCGCGPPGCFCNDGLVRRADGKCIPPNQCHALKQASCPENAEFSTCGSSCKPTCKDPYPAFCSGRCVKGCFCKTSFVEDTDGRCVRLKNCNKKCLRSGEEFQECGSSCPDTCENRRHPPLGNCSYRCKRGCFCKKDLYRTKNGHCVSFKDCEKEHDFTTLKPIMKRENIGAIDEPAPDDSHGCPSRAECEAYCKSLGDFIGLCTGKDRLHCRCA